MQFLRVRSKGNEVPQNNFKQVNAMFQFTFKKVTLYGSRVNGMWGTICSLYQLSNLTIMVVCIKMLVGKMETCG